MLPFIWHWSSKMKIDKGLVQMLSNLECYSDMFFSHISICSLSFKMYDMSLCIIVYCDVANVLPYFNLSDEIIILNFESWIVCWPRLSTGNFSSATDPGIDTNLTCLVVQKRQRTHTWSARWGCALWNELLWTTEKWTHEKWTIVQMNILF